MKREVVKLWRREAGQEKSAVKWAAVGGHYNHRGMCRAAFLSAKSNQLKSAWAYKPTKWHLCAARGSYSIVIKYGAYSRSAHSNIFVRVPRLGARHVALPLRAKWLQILISKRWRLAASRPGSKMCAAQENIAQLYVMAGWLAAWQIIKAFFRRRGVGSRRRNNSRSERPAYLAKARRVRP